MQLPESPIEKIDKELESIASRIMGLQSRYSELMNRRRSITSKAFDDLLEEAKQNRKH